MYRTRPASSSIQIFLARCLVTGLMLAAAMLSFSFFARDADAAEEYYYAYTSIGDRTVRDILIFEGLSEALGSFGSVTAKLIVPGQFETELSGAVVNQCPRSWCTASTLHLEGAVEEQGESYRVRYELRTEESYPEYEVSFRGSLSREDGTYIGYVHAVPVAASEVELP
jgi:hypothetical protein